MQILPFTPRAPILFSQENKPYRTILRLIEEDIPLSWMHRQTLPILCCFTFLGGFLSAPLGPSPKHLSHLTSFSIGEAHATPRKKRRFRRRSKKHHLPSYYRRSRWRWCKKYGLPLSTCKQAWRSHNIDARHRVILGLLQWWKQQLDKTPTKTLAWLAGRREKYFRVSAWWFDRGKRDAVYRLLEMIDMLLHPVLSRYPEPLYQDILQKAGKLLDHPGLSMPRQTALTSRLSRWLTRRPDPQSIESITNLMQRSMLHHHECQWWFLVFMQTFTPQKLAHFSEQKLEASWCTARKLSQEIRFHTPAQSDRILQQLAKAHPRNTRLVRFGKSFEGRPLLALHIHARKRNPDAKNVLMVGAQHADEHMGTEILLHLAQKLLKNKRSATTRALLRKSELWIVPVVNPDGAHFDLAGGVVKIWRYNRSVQPDGQIGVDLNRNYDDHWQPFRYYDRGRVNLPGKRAFSEPETQAIRKLAERLPRLTAILDLHQYGRVVLLPYAFAKKPLPGSYEDLFYKIGQYLIEANRYRTFPAHRLYPHQGTLGDWGFSRFKALSLVLEIGSASYLNPKMEAYVTRRDMKLIDRFLSLADDPFKKILSIKLPPPDPRLVRRTVYKRPAQ